MREPKRIGELLQSLIEKYRLVDPDTWTRLEQDWDSMAGPPWSGRSRPRSLQDGELVVEASSAAAVSMLRYGTGALSERLAEELGTTVVTSVRVVAPRRRSEA